MKIFWSCLLFGIFFFGAFPGSQAADYPANAIELIVTYAPGGSTDTTARLTSPKASKTLGQPFVVINKPGAGGALGYDQVVKSAPDGYTLVLYAINSVILKAINPTLSFHPVQDFAPVSNPPKVSPESRLWPGRGENRRGDRLNGKVRPAGAAAFPGKGVRGLVIARRAVLLWQAAATRRAAVERTDLRLSAWMLR